MATTDFSEVERRKVGARGRPVRLADGQDWLMVEATFRPKATGLTSIDVDPELDRIYEQIVFGEDLTLVDVQGLARSFLLANYRLSESEVAQLVEVESGPEAERLASDVLGLLLGPDEKVRGYVDWVRASLLANGLIFSEIPSSAIGDVMNILVATNRTIPASQFLDACRAVRERESLERFV